MRNGTSLWIALAAAAVTGCTQSTSTTDSTASSQAASAPAVAAPAVKSVETDPCAVLTRAEVGAILKGTVGEPTRNGEQCTWMTAPTNLVSVEPHATGGTTLMTGARGGMAATGASAAAVQGVGDEAFYGAGDSVLYARAGDRYVAVDLRGVAHPRAVGPPLARAALARLR